MKLEDKRIFLIVSLVLAMAITLISAINVYVFLINQYSTPFSGCNSAIIGGPPPTPMIYNGGYPMAWLIDTATQYTCSTNYYSKISISVAGLAIDLIVWFIIVAIILAYLKKKL